MTIGQTAAQIALGSRAPNWPKLAGLCNTEADLEQFRLALVVAGRDTRSARRAIERRQFALNVRRAIHLQHRGMSK